MGHDPRLPAGMSDAAGAVQQAMLIHRPSRLPLQCRLRSRHQGYCELPRSGQAQDLPGALQGMLPGRRTAGLKKFMRV